MRLVLDTNIWLDWLVFDDPGLAFMRASVVSGHAEIVIDAACEAELIRVLGYPLQKWTLDAARQATCLEHCRGLALRVETQGTASLPRCADPDDQIFLELAADAGAGYLITKDRDLLVLARHHPPLPFHIMTPAEFTTPSGVESAGCHSPDELKAFATQPAIRRRHHVGQPRDHASRSPVAAGSAATHDTYHRVRNRCGRTRSDVAATHCCMMKAT